MGTITIWQNLRRMVSNPMDEPGSARKALIGVVGPCGSGKSTLTGGLSLLGYRARHIAQEHSYVKDMWLRLTRPDILVFLQASWQVGGRRRQMDWTLAEWEQQQSRLDHAREHADLYLETDNLSAEQVLTKVLGYLQER